MRTLYILRHSLTEANEKRLYSGDADLPLSPKGRALAEAARRDRPLPVCDLYVTSGMKRADETLLLMTGHRADTVLPRLREMNFGRFELLSYETLKDDPDYVRWITDESGTFPCPGGECTGDFRARVLRGGEELMAMGWDSACLVCHGGVIVNLMQAWFPAENRQFYEWQPAACGGWRVTFEGQDPIGFESIQEAT